MINKHIDKIKLDALIFLQPNTSMSFDKICNRHQAITDLQKTLGLPTAPDLLESNFYVKCKKSEFNELWNKYSTKRQLI